MERTRKPPRLGTYPTTERQTGGQRAKPRRRDFLTATAAATLTPLVGSCGSAPRSSPNVAPKPAFPTSAKAPAEHHLSRDVTHNRWDRDLPPRLTMKSGETVIVETKEASDGHFTPTSTAADVATRDRSRVHPLTGPIFVSEAMPGDTLQIDILDYELPSWGWTCISPPAGIGPVLAT